VKSKTNNNKTNNNSKKKIFFSCLPDDEPDGYEENFIISFLLQA
jgi:hypothetical protein